MKIAKSLEVGEIVYSIAGRDSGRFFIVISVVNDQHVQIVDGTLRKMERPKLKKIKHLKTDGEYLPKIKEKLLNKTKVFDAEVASALRAYNG